VFLSYFSGYYLSKHTLSLGFIDGKYLWKYFNCLDRQ
jgi:hypothetical protein